jgi:uncharacterized damage-inducible protein DinB
MTRSELSEHLAFSAWASRRLLESCRSAPPEVLPKALEKLEHIFLADRIWLARMKANAPSVFRHPGETFDLESLRLAWEPLHADWVALAESAEPDRVVPYKTLDGTPRENTIRQTVLHVVNHATYHRGQVSALLRAAGIQPLATDLIEYYRAK